MEVLVVALVIIIFFLRSMFTKWDRNQSSIVLFSIKMKKYGCMSINSNVEPKFKSFVRSDLVFTVRVKQKQLLPGDYLVFLPVILRNQENWNLVFDRFIERFNELEQSKPILVSGAKTQ